MTIGWFTKRAGDNTAPSVDDPAMALVGSGRPDWVRLPDNLGGARVRVLGVKREPCPRDTSHAVTHYHTDAGISVAECPDHGGFLWYKARK